MALDPVQVERDRVVLWRQVERRYEPGGDGLCLDALLVGLPTDDLCAVRAYLGNELEKFDAGTRLACVLPGRSLLPVNVVAFQGGR